MQTFDVEVTRTIRVTLDETKFTEEFMDEFRQLIFPAFDTRDHAEHLASLYARGDIDYDGDFVEGYGVIRDMGIKFDDLEENVYVVSG